MDTAARDDVIATFARTVYGADPDLIVATTVRSHTQREGLGATATIHNLVLETQTAFGIHAALMTVVHPRSHAGVPMFLGLNFRGNHTISTDAAFAVPASPQARLAYDAHTSNPQERGAQSSRWPLSRIVERGFGVATVCYLQLGPDSPQLWNAGLMPILQPANPQRWGGLGMWAWYLRRMLDVLREESLGTSHIAFGHSRLGKAALWAAAQDPRFDGVIANNSGCMGASLSQAPGAETPGLLARVRPYWFNEDFVKRMLGGTAPVLSQDRLLEAITPRPVYVASAEDDLPADPTGEEAAVALVRAAMPGAPIGYHRRSGGHDVTAEDWERFMDFFDSRRAERIGTQPNNSENGVKG